MMTKRMKIVKIAVFSTLALIIMFSAVANANNYVLIDDMLHTKHSQSWVINDDEPGPGVGGWDSIDKSTQDEPGPGVGGWDSITIGVLDDEPGPGVGGWDNIKIGFNDGEPGPGVGGWDSITIGLFDDEPGPGVGGWD